jgi:hypothetical protein
MSAGLWLFMACRRGSAACLIVPGHPVCPASKYKLNYLHL